MAEEKYWDFLRCAEDAAVAGVRSHRHGDVRLQSQGGEASWSKEARSKHHAAVAECYNSPGASKWDHGSQRDANGWYKQPWPKEEWSEEEWSNAAAREWSTEEWDAWWQEWDFRRQRSRSLDEKGNDMGDDGANNNSDVANATEEQREQAPQDKSANDQSSSQDSDEKQNEEIHKEEDIAAKERIAVPAPLPSKAPPLSWKHANAPPPVQPSGPPLPPQQASLSQQTPQSRCSADGVAAQQFAVPPGLADNDWNRTLDRIKSAKVYDARFYKELFAETRPHDTYKQHNAAAKWFRHVCLEGDHSCLEMLNASAVAVKPVQHTQGTSYEFLMDEDAHWIWHEMIGQLEDASIDLVCSVPLVRCEFAFRGKQKGPTGELVWDFRVHRQDGTVMTLHPEWTRTKFKGMEFANAPAAADHLAAVTTYSADAKRCAHFRNSLGTVQLKFDPKKRPSKPQ